MSVLLGFADVKIKSSEEIGWTTNKIGALPDWYDDIDIKTFPSCDLCTSKLYHLVQIYAPLQNSIYNRTLNIFGCANKSCWNKYGSIVVLRSQKEEAKPVKEQKAKNCDNWGVDDWGSDKDDWGESPHPKEYEEAIFLSNVVSTKKIEEEMDTLSVQEGSDINLDVPFFSGHYVYVMEEGILDQQAQSMDYEMKLYQEYISREGDISLIDETPGDKKKKNTEKYEKTKSKDQDQLFHQFQKRISGFPEQVLRYEWGGKPLLLSSKSPLSPPLTSVPDCQYCKSTRVFELQLLPSLVAYFRNENDESRNKEEETSSLNEVDVTNSISNIENETNADGNTLRQTFKSLDEDENVRVEFGCIYIFSCSKACWDGTTPRCEHVVLQADPDLDLLNKKMRT